MTYKLQCFFTFVFSLVWTFNLAQAPDIKFKQITEGISHSHVKSIFQDHQGFLWFGTNDGLNKFNGYTIEVFKNHPEDTLSIIGSNVHRIFEDRDKNIWISTNKGASRYNRSTGRFINQEELRGIDITVLEDTHGNLWGYGWNNLYLFNPRTQIFDLYDVFEPAIKYFYQDKKGIFWAVSDTHVYNYNIDNKSLALVDFAIKSVVQILEDSKGRVWFASMEEGLFLYNRENQSLKRYVQDERKTNSISKNAVQALYEDHRGRIWIGTMNGGLNIFDVDKEVFYSYYNSLHDPNSLSFNSIYSFCEDKNQNMWVGTFSGGVDFVEEINFFLHRSKINDANSLSENRMLFFWEDHQNNIWIGTDGGGLNIFDRTNNIFKQHRHNRSDRNSIPSDVVISIAEDRKGGVWLGHWEAGISYYDRKSNRFINYKPSRDLHNSTWIDDCILYMYNDKQDNLWVATLRELTMFDNKNKKFISYNIEAGGLLNYVGSILEDKDGDFWIGSWDGLYKLNRNTKEYDLYRHNNQDPTSLSNNQIYMLYEDSKGRMWIGTAGGLNLFDKSSNTFKIIQEKDGLPSNAIYSISEDNQGNLWLGTGNGLSKFDLENWVFRNFDINDGLQGNEFKNHACLKLQSGELIFGGANGFNLFDPSKIKINEYVPPIVFSDFKIFNKPVIIGAEHSPLKKHISQIDLLELNHYHSVLSFEFAALNYRSPVKNKYAYKMEGFDRDWIYSGSTRAVTYTNLNPGTYTLKVKGSNNDGIWNEEGAAITIIIKPAFYQTWWFKTFGVMILIISIWFIVSTLTIKQQQKQLEIQVQERTAELSIQKENLVKANMEIIDQGTKLSILYKEMKDSIKAAKAIQQSVLPTVTQLYHYFPESFILDKPKDEVSGDFYWIDKIENKVLIAVIDCTGHGVSGAFMSIIGSHLLNQSIHSSSCITAAGILDKLNCNLIQELRQFEEGAGFGYGMDISLCILDLKARSLNFAGANSPLFRMSDGQLHTYKANRFPIGLHIRNEVHQFDDTFIELQSGDMIYMFTDGYADQIGGPAGDEKFMYQRFRNLLVGISDKDIGFQKHHLEQTLNIWQNNQEQLDDILLLGIRV
jgi:ligand-binding sensor domain-containing protein/serine phosphatase RsbU (regulator of sigma subunit)